MTVRIFFLEFGFPVAIPHVVGLVVCQVFLRRARRMFSAVAVSQWLWCLAADLKHAVATAAAPIVATAAAFRWQDAGGSRAV